MINSKRKQLPLSCLLLVITVLLQTGGLPIVQARPGTDSASEALRRGEDLRRRWDIEGAEAAFRKAATLEPANLEAALGLARIARARAFGAAAPIRFGLAGEKDAELMGDGLGTDETICSDDGACSYTPNPGAAIGPDLASLAGSAAPGEWQVCVGDSCGGFTATLQLVRLRLTRAK